MRSFKMLLLLALLTFGALFAALYSPLHPVNMAPEVGRLLPELAAQLNQVTRIAVERAGETLHLQRQGDAWHLVEKADYPAQAERVREVLLGLAGLQRREAKTRNPEHYLDLGLADPSATDNEASRLTLQTANGDTLATVILGKRRPSRTEVTRGELFARLPNDPQTWLVEGQLPVIGGAASWLEHTLLTLETKRIAEVTLTRNNGETLRILPKTDAAGGFTLDGLTAAETLKPYVVEDMAARFTRLQLEDVRRADSVTWPAKPDLTATLRTQDGLLVRLEVSKVDERPWMRLNAETISASATPATPDAATLNARWQGWAFALADWAYQTLDKPRSELLKAPEVPATAAGAATSDTTAAPTELPAEDELPPDELSIPSLPPPAETETTGAGSG